MSADGKLSWVTGRICRWTCTSQLLFLWSCLSSQNKVLSSRKIAYCTFFGEKHDNWELTHAKSEAELAFSSVEQTLLSWLSWVELIELLWWLLLLCLSCDTHNDTHSTDSSHSNALILYTKGSNSQLDQSCVTFQLVSDPWFSCFEWLVASKIQEYPLTQSDDVQSQAVTGSLDCEVLWGTALRRDVHRHDSH